jgi:hypothetical protein
VDFTVICCEDKGYCLIKTTGKISIQDIEKILVEIFSNSSWRVGMHLLFDNREEIFDDLSNIEVQLIAQVFTQFNEQLNNSKIALVMPKDLGYGIARMWETYTSLNERAFLTKVFRKVEEAREWIEEKDTQTSDSD